MQHFLKVTDFNLEHAQAVFSQAKSFKANRYSTSPTSPILDKQSWGLLFYKNSTRTRVSFEVGIKELGGHPIVLDSQQTQISRGETIEDSSKVLSRYLRGLIIRTYEHTIIESFAQYATIPVINGLTNFGHPCQLYADIFTLLERYSPDRLDINKLKGKKVAFFGDVASNMANSWILTAALFDIKIILAGPEDYKPGQDVITALKENSLPVDFTYTSDPKEAAKDADVLYTDVWVSMGDEALAKQRLKQMAPYQVNTKLLELANPDAYFMHCLPAHANEEVSQAVLDSPQSIIFDQAENRLHVQKAIMAKLVELNTGF